MVMEVYLINPNGRKSLCRFKRAVSRPFRGTTSTLIDYGPAMIRLLSILKIDFLCIRRSDKSIGVLMTSRALSRGLHLSREEC